MPTPEVEFSDQDKDGNPCHLYFLDGKEIPGLSYILEFSGFSRYDKVNGKVMEAARERGEAADTAVNLFNEDFPKYETLERVSLDNWEANYLLEPLDNWTRSRLNGWIKFRKDFKFDVYLIQKRMSHEHCGMLYAFTLDCFGKMNGKDAIVEVKATADCEPSHSIQTLAQSLPFGEVQRWGCYLRENDYRPEQFTDRKDKQIFGCMLALTWYKWGKGIR